MADIKIIINNNRGGTVYGFRDVSEEFARVLVWMLEERAYQHVKFGYGELDVKHALEGLGDGSWYWEKGVLNYTGRVRLFGVTTPLGMQALLKLGSTILSMPEHLLRSGDVEWLPNGGVPSGSILR